MLYVIAAGALAGLVLFEVGPRAIGGRADPSGFFEMLGQLAEKTWNATGFGDCHIKGNISKSGERIYHVPGAKYYSGTQIDFLWGERFFCTEEEARQAGWRKSRV